jgi:glucose-1-phosphate thymidylyltransferase
VRGPAAIASGAKILDSYIGPFTAVGEGCEITGSELEHSVVLREARIIDAGRITDSLIGKYTEVFRTRRRPVATRLMLGDHSQVDLG